MYSKNVNNKGILGLTGRYGLEEEIDQVVAFVKQNPDITGLDISACKERLSIKTFSALASMPSLRSLNLSSNQFDTECMEVFRNNNTIKILEVEMCALGIKGAEVISTMTALKALGIACNKIGDEGAQALASLKKLKKLDVSANRLKDKGALAIAAIESLYDLNFSSNEIGKEGAIGLARTNLRILNIQNNPITDSIVESLASLKGLRELNLSNTNVGDGACKALALNKTLHWLLINGTEIGDSGLKILSSSASIKYINTFNVNNMTEEGYVALYGFDPLKEANYGRVVGIATEVPSLKKLGFFTQSMKIKNQMSTSNGKITETECIALMGGPDLYDEFVESVRKCYV